MDEFFNNLPFQEIRQQEPFWYSFVLALLAGALFYIVVSSLVSMFSVGGALSKLRHVDSWAPEWKLVLAILGIYSCYLTYGVLQEGIFSYKLENGDGFKDTMFLLLVQCVINALFAAVAILFSSPSSPSSSSSSSSFVSSLLPYFPAGAAYIGAMLCSNEALKYVNYPTQALGKSCKMIPVFLFGIIIRGKRYSVYEWFSVISITVGIAIFNLFKNSSKAVASVEELTEEEIAHQNYLQTVGVLLLFASLVLDGFTGSFQDGLRDKYKPSSHVLMLNNNLVAILILLVGCIVTGQLQSGIAFANAASSASSSSSFWVQLFIFSLSSAFGQSFIFFTIKHFNALVLTTITTTRKFFTILFSIFLFGHKLNDKQWIGLFFVIGGLSVELYYKYQKKRKTPANDESGKEGKGTLQDREAGHPHAN